MKPLLFFLIPLFMILPCSSQTVRFEGKVLFEETRMDKFPNIIWHKRWENYRLGTEAVSGMLIHEIIDDKFIAQENERLNAHIHAELLSDYKNGYKKRLWVIDTIGSETGMEAEFYVVTKNGCCSEQPRYYYYNLKSGKFIGTFSVNLVQVSAIRKTYFGFIDQEDWFRMNWGNTLEKSHKGILLTSEKIISTIDIAEKTVLEWRPRISVNRDIVSLCYYDGKQIDIKIIGDSLVVMGKK